MQYTGNIRKMNTQKAEKINYFLPIGNQEVFLNDLIGKNLKISYHHQINCIKCGQRTNKSFSQGFCYPCFTSAPETEECVLRPELCRAHEGIARDMEFANNHCLIEQYVYLSLTSGVKVGVTRSTQIPTRWIDQGAVKAVIIAKTPYRKLAGDIEVALKDHFADKTNWRNMLKNVYEEIDLYHVKEGIKEKLPADLKSYFAENEKVTELHYPVQKYPLKPKPVNLEKTPVINSKLLGIKGQYLFFEDDLVINVRKYGGYYITLNL